MRVAWLEAKVAAGLGRADDALAAFEHVRIQFRKRELAYDYALVSLDLSLALLAQGRPQEVQAIAEEMYWIFNAQGVHREALSALGLFREAARQQTATAELVLRVVSFLRRHQADPELRFEGA